MTLFTCNQRSEMYGFMLRSLKQSTSNKSSYKQKLSVSLTYYASLHTPCMAKMLRRSCTIIFVSTSFPAQIGTSVRN